MFDVSIDEVEASVNRPSVAAFRYSIDSDISPLEVYGSVSGDYSFLLESAEIDVSALKEVSSDGAAPRNSRYSFIGYNPAAVFRVNNARVSTEVLEPRYRDLIQKLELDESSGDTFDALRRCLPELDLINFEDSERQVFNGGLVGYISYDAVHDVWLDRENKKGDWDDAVFVLSTRNLVFDHKQGTIDALYTPLVSPESVRDVYREMEDEVRELESSIRSNEESGDQGFSVMEKTEEDPDDFKEAVRRAREHIYAGDIYQAVLSRSWRLHANGDPVDLYRALRSINPSPYMYLIEFMDKGIVGSSPETLVSVYGDTVTTNPIAGTCKRGETIVEDRRLSGEMLSDEKELAEHVMLVDLGRNDVRRVSRSGSVRVDDFMSVVQYSHVQHLESTVSGELRGEMDQFDATRAIFPAGTLSGAPKIRAMEIIDDLEQNPRGVYGGGIGYYSWTGDADFAITIRTASYQRDGDDLEVEVRAGAGIVADSEPEREYVETEDKMDALLTAMQELDDGGER